jgi:protein subunit release factor A
MNKRDFVFEVDPGTRPFSVIVTHKKSGLTVRCNETNSVPENKRRALSKLLNMLEVIKNDNYTTQNV